MERRPMRMGPRSGTRRGIDWMPLEYNRREEPFILPSGDYDLAGPWFGGNGESITPPSNSWYGDENAVIVRKKVEKRSAPTIMRIESMQMKILE